VDIGKEKPAVIVEPLDDPFRAAPQPQPAPVPSPLPEPRDGPAYGPHQWSAVRR